jgi:HK97 family phage major capsid protein
METAELIELVTTNHRAVVDRFEKAEKATSEVGEIKSQIAVMEQRMARGFNGIRSGAGSETKSWGQEIVDSEQFKSFRENGYRGATRLELKTVSTIGSGAGSAGSMIRPDIVTDPTILPRRRLTIRDLLSQGTTTGNSVWFPRMNGRQNNASVVAESTQKPKSDFTISQIQTPVVTIAHLMQVARQAMDDAPALQSLIDAELRYGLAITEEAELLAGDGTGSHLLGLLPQASAYSAAFAFTGETAIDRIAMAILQSELAQLPANGVVLHPTDWMKMRLQKDAQGKYLLGDPAEAGTPVLWGLPVVATTAITSGSFLVGSFSAAAQIFDRMAVEVLISSENANNFEINQMTVRCESRLALAVKQPLALITGGFPA